MDLKTSVWYHLKVILRVHSDAERVKARLHLFFLLVTFILIIVVQRSNPIVLPDLEEWVLRKVGFPDCDS